VTDTDEAPGWHAIDAALAALYPGVKPFHVGYMPPPALGGTGLQGCSAYPNGVTWKNRPVASDGAARSTSWTAW